MGIQFVGCFRGLASKCRGTLLVSDRYEASWLTVSPAWSERATKSVDILDYPCYPRHGGRSTVRLPGGQYRKE